MARRARGAGDRSAREAARGGSRDTGHDAHACVTLLQGVYQSMQATAAAVQVNNLHLLRGLIGSRARRYYK